MMKDGFVIPKMEAANPETGDIRVHRLRSADETQQNVCCHIVAERNGQSQKLAQGQINSGIGVLILQRTVDVRQDAILRTEPYRPIQRERALLDLMQHRENERKLED